MLKIKAIGGYSEVGKHCTAVIVDDEVVLLDMGLHMENYIAYTEDEDVTDFSANELMKVEAIPNINMLGHYKNQVKALVVGHAHLDHIGAIPFLAEKIDAPILGTDFTLTVLDKICKEERRKLKNKMVTLNPNSSYKLTDKITVEFVNSTHSIPQTVFIVLHTPYGKVVYTLDFKIDNSPTIGKKPNMERLRELGDEGKVAVVIVDSVRASTNSKTPSEAIAKEMLKEVMLGMRHEGAIVISTFSSHIARLKSIVDFGKQMNRKIYFMGRSLHKYVMAAEEVGIAKFSDRIEMVKYSVKVARKLKEIEKDKKKLLLVVTGHQGEPKSVLGKISTGDIHFKLDNKDSIIFSCNVIPTSINKANRERLEETLKRYGVRLFTDVHVSGHPMREDVRELISALKPKKILPSHGDLEIRTSVAKVVMDMGYKIGESIIMIEDGDEITI